MKLIQTFVSSALACCVAAAMVTTVAAQTAQQGIAKVVNIHGSARFMTTDNPTWRPLKAGALLKPGTTVQTASESYVDVVLNNPKATEAAMSPTSSSSSPPAMGASNSNHPRVEQDAVRIFENTVLGIDKLTITQTGVDKVSETQLDLKAGRIFGTVKKLTAGSKYEIKIPNGVAGIRGTIYLITADGEVNVLSSIDELTKKVSPGSLVLAYFGADGNIITQVVGDGKHFDSRTGQLASIPDSTFQSMLDLAAQLGLRPASNGVFVEFAVDRTVYILSPSRASGKHAPAGG